MLVDLNSDSPCNKFTIFTPESAFVKNIALYPHTIVPEKWENNHINIAKASTFSNEEECNNHISTFIADQSSRVLVLLVDMDVVSKTRINHIQWMIEENERKKEANHKKLFVLLLHTSQNFR